MVNLTIGGGNFKGIGYLGALEYLYKNDLVNNIENYYGNSVGSIIGIFFCTNVKPIDILKIILELDFKKYWNVDIYNIDKNFSILDNSIFKKISEIYSQYEDPNITFINFYNKYKINLNIISTSLKSRKNVIFNKDNYPDLKILKAVEASCAIPFIFPPVIINNEYFIDGCMKCVDGIINDIIDKNDIHFVIKGDYRKINKINTFTQYIGEVVNSVLQSYDIIDTEYTISIKPDEKYQNKYNFNDISYSDKLKIYYNGLIIAKNKFEHKIEIFKKLISENKLEKHEENKINEKNQTKHENNTNNTNIINEIHKENKTEQDYKEQQENKIEEDYKEQQENKTEQDDKEQYKNKQDKENELDNEKQADIEK